MSEPAVVVIARVGLIVLGVWVGVPFYHDAMALPHDDHTNRDLAVAFACLVFVAVGLVGFA